jgi:hypothetical protein
MANNQIAKLLEVEPLYRKIELDRKDFHPYTISKTRFDFYCENEKSKKTFHLRFALDSLLDEQRIWDQQKVLDPFVSDNKIESFHHYKGVCQSCQNYIVHFTLHVFTEGEAYRSNYLDPLVTPVFTSTGGRGGIREEVVDKSKLYIRKVGQWPRYEVETDSEVSNFLNIEDRQYYRNAISCIKQNLGIAAYSYYRKIIESEIVRLVESVTGGTGNDSKITDALEDYRKNKRVSDLLDAVFPFLPTSLKILDDNPLKLLYGNLSLGLHQMSDEECLNKAIAVDKLFSYTIKRINEDKNETKDIKNIIKSLR